MIRHLLKPMWRRKGRNLLLSLEIALAFAVVFAISATGLRYWQLYHLPVGFAWQDVWTVQLLMPDDQKTDDLGLYGRYERALKELPEVESIAFSAYTPYENSEWNTDFEVADGSRRKVETNLMQVNDAFFDTMDVKVVEGRAFSARDEGAAQRPVLVDRRFAEKAFPGQSAIGKLLTPSQWDDASQKPAFKPEDQRRIVGVVDSFRNQGEFMTPKGFLFERFSPLAPAKDPVSMRTMLLKVRPGTTRMFEVELSRRLKMVKNDASYRISPMKDMRDSQLRGDAAPLVLLAVIAAFLLLMVSFGLFGVLWQNTTRRTAELGLRRALGATAGDITRQIVLEQVLLCLLPIAAALLLLVQLPITGALGEKLSWGLFGGATLLSALVMVLVSVGCALYPAWRASRLSPTEALHYE
jgi:putative ABC transport system permease protein